MTLHARGGPWSNPTLANRGHMPIPTRTGSYTSGAGTAVFSPQTIPQLVHGYPVGIPVLTFYERKGIWHVPLWDVAKPTSNALMSS